MGILICSFDKRTGWRVKRREAEGDPRIRVIVEDGKKYLSIPTIHLQRNGRFCNPAKLAVEWTRVCGYPGSAHMPNVVESSHEKEYRKENQNRQLAISG